MSPRLRPPLSPGPVPSPFASSARVRRAGPFAFLVSRKIGDPNPTARCRMRCCLCLLLTLGLCLPAAAQDDKDEGPEPEGKVRLTLETGGHTSLITKVLFTPDSSQLITLANDQSIRVWDVETGECVNVLYPPLHVHPSTA